ncbi:MAG: zinc ribbon domain-containing protein [Acidobacteriota bacterium]
MDNIAQVRESLDDLSTGESASLAACRERQEALRRLKRQVLARIFALRNDVRGQAEKTRGPKPTVDELWERRDEGAKALLEDVHESVIGLVDDDSEDAIEAWSELNREIDALLEKLEALERKLSASAPAIDRDRLLNIGRQDDSEDDLYAAVGAAVQKGAKDGPFCPHCGQRIDATDRFCRRCGHRLGRDSPNA